MCFCVARPRTGETTKKQNDFMKLESITPRPATLTITTALKHVLTVDDDADMLSMYAHMLADTGYTVETAADGEQGWDALCDTEYDLLLTDNSMPRLTGLELVARLRGAGMTLPVILASGSFTPPAGYDERERLGLSAVLRKPFTRDELIAAVEHAIPFQPVTSVYSSLASAGGLVDIHEPTAFYRLE